MKVIETRSSSSEYRLRKLSNAFDTFKRIFRSPSAKLGGCIFGLIVLLAIFAPFIAPYSATKMDYANMYATPSAAHWLGTDEVGRDILSRLLYGAKYSLIVGIVAEIIAQMTGIIIGCFAGYFGKKVEAVIMRFCDIWSAIPALLLSILLSAVLGPGFLNTVLALAVGGVPSTIRMIRGQILAEKSKEYLEAAESINCSRRGIMFSHLLPNVVSPVLVSASLGVGKKITAAAGLSYLGLGIQPPTPEWGAMLSDGTSVLLIYPHVVLFPGIAIGLLILSINLMGDGLRDALDPKLRY